MIKTFGKVNTRRFWREDKDPKCSGLDLELAHERLDMLDAAEKLGDISPLKSVGLHKLKGRLKEFWSINVNDHWRIIFKFKDGDAYEVEIRDTH